MMRTGTPKQHKANTELSLFLLNETRTGRKAQLQWSGSPAPPRRLLLLTF